MNNKNKKSVANINVLISTHNDGINKIKKEHLPQHEDVKYIIAHQKSNYNKNNKNNKNNKRNIQYCNNIQIFRLNSKGLSKNRNYLLKKLNAKIGLIADDDVGYEYEYFNKILDAFNQNPDADIITFKVKCIDEDKSLSFKKYKKKPFVHTVASIFGVSSIEIAFRQTAIAKYDLNFDERFGIGSHYCSGEENLFLIQAKRRGAKIIYWPEYICCHPYETSQRNHSLNIVIAKKNGALFALVWGRVAYILIFFSFLKNLRLFKSKKAAFNFLKFGFLEARKILS